MADCTVADVVNVMFPKQEAPTEFTFRPAIVVEDFGDSVDLVFMTKNAGQITRYPGSFIVTKDSSDGIEMGLAFDPATISKRFIHSKRGTCPDEIMKKVEDQYFK
ncbi:MAG: hypothetical protein H6581_27170 [Bacteroidia bacterium]|nr:hypothetical protein [Bacteroidia bacterium]